MNDKPDVPAELEMLQSLLDTAIQVSDGARDELDALELEYSELAERMAQASARLDAAELEEEEALHGYRLALRELGYVRTATGPKPAPGRHELGAKTTFDADMLPTWRPDVTERAGGLTAHRATGTGGQVEIQCCGVWIDYPTPGHDETCSVCGSTFTVGAPS